MSKYGHVKRNYRYGTAKHNSELHSDELCSTVHNPASAPHAVVLRQKHECFRTLQALVGAQQIAYEVFNAIVGLTLKAIRTKLVVVGMPPIRSRVVGALHISRLADRRGRLAPHTASHTR